ncbi:Uncharacterised protein [Mycobacteroides abscessus subsp. abscessus]|nr:Uncharacterised protein [Mycobacteroides abscessus subsp. abscessus]
MAMRLQGSVSIRVCSSSYSVKSMTISGSRCRRRPRGVSQDKPNSPSRPGKSMWSSASGAVMTAAGPSGSLIRPGASQMKYGLIGTSLRLTTRIEPTFCPLVDCHMPTRSGRRQRGSPEAASTSS